MAHGTGRAISLWRQQVNSMAEFGHNLLPLTLNSVLLTIVATDSFLLPLLSRVQVDRRGPKGSANSKFMPVSISGACLLLLYTPLPTLKSNEWVTEFARHRWSRNVPVAIFNHKAREPRPRTSNH